MFIFTSNCKAVPLIVRVFRQWMCVEPKKNNILYFKRFQNFRGLSSSKAEAVVYRSFHALNNSSSNMHNWKSQQPDQARYISFSEKRLKETISAADMKKAMDQLTEQFMEARELIEDARESMETVYFSEDMAEAQEAVQATLDQYQKLLDQLSENQRQDVLRTIGLRMEELKAQEQALKDAVLESH